MSHDLVVFLTVLMVGTWTLLGCYAAADYFTFVRFHGNSHSFSSRELVPCDWLFVLLFGPIVWLTALVLTICWLLRDVSWDRLSPAAWSRWVGEHCALKKKSQEKKESAR